jgi:hypothetical protein
MSNRRPTFPKPIGSLLVDQGTINAAQCDAILQRQRATRRPFGEIAEEMFGISARAVESAWAKQYAQIAEWVDPTADRPDPAVLGLVSRRQAWQFRVLPMAQKGGTLTVCTTPGDLVRALNFSVRHFAATPYLVLAKAQHLGEALARLYPMHGMTADSLARPVTGPSETR